MQDEKRSWAALTRIAARQHALVTSRQLEALGWTSKARGRLVAAGRLRRRYQTVYELAGSGASADRELMAAVLACGDGSLLTSPTAIGFHGLPGLVADDDGVHVLRPWHAKGSHEGIRPHRSRLVVPADRAVRRGIPVVTVARAIVDVSGHPAVDDRTLEWMVDHARRNGLGLHALAACARRLRPGPGRRPNRILALVDRRLGTTPAESLPELRIARLLEDAGYGRPTMGIPIVVATGEAFRMDGGYLDCLVAFEYHSWQEHGQEMWLPFHEDIRRAGLIRAMGWDLHFVTSEMSDADVLLIVGGAIEARRAAAAVVPEMSR